MSRRAPPIDGRTATDIARQTEALLATYVPAWRETDPTTGRATGISAALIGAFARFAELTIQRLNLAPDKNRLAFLDMLGATPLSAQPARVPLTFALAAGAAGASVPARTPVAAPPGPLGGKPVLFETEAALALTPATLARVVSWDGSGDRWADLGPVAQVANGAAFRIFEGVTPVLHAFYLAQDALFGFSTISLTLTVTLSHAVPPTDPYDITWELWDGEAATRLPYLGEAPGIPGIDDTHGLMQSGVIDFEPLRLVPRSTVAGREGRWLRCRLLTPVTDSAVSVAGKVRAAQLPRIEQIIVQGSGNSDPVLPDAAFAGIVPLDASRDFFPFGETPAFGATFYLGSRSVLSNAGRRITVSIPVSFKGAYPWRAETQAELTITWEYWDGLAWSRLGTSTPRITTPENDSSLVDGSRAFTDSGGISFILSRAAQPTTVNGVESCWLRARLSNGGYGRTAPEPAGPSVSGATLSFAAESVFYNMPQDPFVTVDGMRWAVSSGPFAAFAPAEDAGRSLYLGFALPPAMTAFPQRPVSLYAEVADIPVGTSPDTPMPSPAPRLSWSAWTGAVWETLTVADQTAAFTVPGTVTFLPPGDFRITALFDSAALYWVRARWVGGDYGFLPRLRRLLVNTIMAEQAMTVRDEVLGSGSGQAGQLCVAAQTPVLDGVRLIVIEPELPAVAERAALLREDEGAIAPAAGGGFRVLWREVGDFHGSGPRDRHFVLDHQSGRIGFGDGNTGQLPRAGIGNLLLASYRTGGGAAGNVPAGAITQVKTTLPSVTGVVNPLPASGGVGAESLDLLIDRAPRSVRHGGRAVTLEDFQDLAGAASPEVARSLAAPLVDLGIDPDGATAVPGVVSVVIVPRADALRPAPSVELVGRVRSSLSARALPGVRIVVVGPDYVSVDVHAEISLTRLEDAAVVDAAARAALAAFLHPLTGGADGTGWDFGRRPHVSDLHGLLQAIEGVDHLRGLRIGLIADRAGAVETARFLVCSGRHQIDLAFGR